jgi:hypothetical protein
MQKIPQWDSRTDNSDNCDKLFEKDLVVTESGLLRPAGGAAKTDTVYGGMAVGPGGQLQRLARKQGLPKRSPVSDNSVPVRLVLGSLLAAS